MGKINVQSYRAHREVMSCLILLKFRTSCGSVEDWEINTLKRVRHLKKKKKKASLYCHYFVLHFPISSFVFLLVVGLRERDDFCIPAIQITKALLDLSDIYHFSHSMLGLNPTALIYMCNSLIKTIRCYLTAYVGSS